MGHERTGILPKSKTWRKVIAKISEVPSDESAIGDIASQVIKNVKKKLVNVEQDNGIRAAFQFLLFLSQSAKEKEPTDYFQSLGIPINDLDSTLQIAKSVSQWIDKNKQSNEYATVARGAVIDAIGIWKKQNTTNQGSLFSDDSQNVWERATNGSGFCELSRLFFSKFTERYLKYFLEREASSSLPSISDRNNFNSNLESHVQEISNHAFETAKITQSFAAGWYNKNVKSDIPTDQQIEGFLHIAFGKMRAELLREEKRKELDE